MIISAIVLVVLFSAFSYHYINSGTSQAQQAVISSAQTLFGNSSQAVTTTVNGGVAAIAVSPPTISGVTWNTSTWSPSLTIDGLNFGSNAKVTALTDLTKNWGLGGIQPTIVSQTNTEIQIANLFGGGDSYGSGDTITWSDGQGSYSFRPGDQVQVGVTDAQGQQATFTTTYPTNATMPNTTLIASSTVVSENATVILSGQVTFNGSTIPYWQAVDLTATGGTLSGTAIPGSPNVFMTASDATTGNWSTTYTAPSTPGTYTVTASFAGQPVSTTITVLAPSITGVTWNTSTWSPSMTISGNGFGTSGILAVIEDAQGQGAVWDNNPQTPDDKLQVSSWNATSISDGNLQSYGAATGFYFSPGEAVGFIITNGQTGQNLSYTATYPSNAPMPTVTLNTIADVAMGGNKTPVTGTVMFNGTALANQQVVLSASSGSFSSSTVTTNATGQFSTNYISPSSASGTYQVTAAADAVSATQNVHVVVAPSISSVS